MALVSNPKYALQLTTIHSDMVRQIFDPVKEILGDINMVFSKDGMKIVNMDNTKSTVVHLKLDAEKIRKDGVYIYNTSAPYLLAGVTMRNFYQLIKRLSKDDILSLIMEKGDEQNNLIIRIENGQKNAVSTLKYRLLALDHFAIEYPDFEMDAEVIMPSQDFQKYVKSVANISDVLEIRSIGKQLVFKATGDWAEDKTIINESQDQLKIPKEAQIPIQGKFPIKFLLLFVKATNLCVNVKLLLANEKPLILEYTIPELGSLKFLLSPHWEADEN